MKMNYCYLCGHSVDPIETHDGVHWKCSGCAQTFYDNPKPATEAVLVTEDNRIVVAVRARDPYRGKLDLPGGFVDSGESIEQALARELREELGLEPSDYSPPAYLSSGVDNYPWGPELHDVVSVAFTARINSSVELTPLDDVASIEYRTLASLSPDDFAWSTQYPLVQAAIEYWKNNSYRGDISAQ